MDIQEWQHHYRKRKTSPAEALSPIRRGSRLFIGSGCGQPRLLVKALIERALDLADTEIMHFMTIGKTPENLFNRSFRHNAFFVGPSTRDAISEGDADYSPVFLSEIPLLFKRGRLHIDTALITVTPPDEFGYVSLGVAVDVTKTAAECADYVVAEVNPAMPTTLGDSFLHVSRIDAFVESNAPMPEFFSEDPGHTARQIGKNVASLVEDGATIQVGYGSIPNAVVHFLKDKSDLGVHTEMFTDSLIDLVESGVVNCRRKSLHPGKIVASFCMGSQRLYAFINHNPIFEFHSSDYVNDPFVIADNDRMVSINAALSVDLTGQVCSDSLGYLFYTGIGGQVDFVRGSSRSRHGKSIIALPSTAENGKKSRIVPSLEEGSGVVLTRGDVHYVVTEYGIAYLHGKTIRERVMALISIAHPSFRAALLEAARLRGYVFRNQRLAAGALYPEKYETYFNDTRGREIFFRPSKPVDEKKVQDLVYTLSDEDLYRRFFQNIKVFPREKAAPVVNVDYDNRMTIVGIIGEDGPDSREQIIAIGQYVKDRAGTANVALTVDHDYQCCGIGTFLLWYLIQVARENGVNSFVAEVLKDNDAIMKISQRCGYPFRATWAYGGVYTISLTLDEKE